MLIWHGGLQGVDESTGQIVLRTRRVFCSNRNARTGCGRTFRIWRTDRIRRLNVTTRRLWKSLGMAVVVSASRSNCTVMPVVAFDANENASN